MKAIIVDDERAGVQYLLRICYGISSLEVVQTFTNPVEALAFLRSGRAELAFLDVEMPGISGMEIAQTIRREHIPAAVVFVTGYEQYALPAFQADAVSYLLKPCDADDVRAAAEKAARLLAPEHASVVVQTFDRFDLFVGDRPVHFANAKAKELLAILVDHRGADVTMGFLIDMLWPDREYDENVKQLYRKAISYLHRTLGACGAAAVFSSSRGSCRVNPAAFSCDYYDFLAGDPAARAKFNEKYMYEYSWAEETLALLMRGSS